MCTINSLHGFPICTIDYSTHPVCILSTTSCGLLAAVDGIAGDSLERNIRAISSAISDLFG